MSTYVPILSAEASRLAGLAATTDAVKDRLVPLFDVPAASAGAAPADAPAVPARLAEVLDAVGAAFGHRRAFLDCREDVARLADGRLHAAWLLDEARARGLVLVPVTGLRRSAAHQLAAADAASVDGRGVCLRLEFPDFESAGTLSERVHALVDALGVVPEQVDLLIDLGRVAADEGRALAVAARAVLSPLWRAARWRSVALAAAGRTLERRRFRGPHGVADAAAAPGPTPHGTQNGAAHGAQNGTPHGAGPGAPDRVPRTEWLLWRALAADAPTLGFGDYAGPGGGEGGLLPPRPRGDAADDWLGYARDAEWLLLRPGAPADAPAGAPGGEVADAPAAGGVDGDRAPAGLARDCVDGPAPLAGLARRPEFYGVAHCAGDARLVAERPAAGPRAAGLSADGALYDTLVGALAGPLAGPPADRDPALAAWRAAAVTHHLTVTVEELARAERAGR